MDISKEKDYSEALTKYIMDKYPDDYIDVCTAVKPISVKIENEFRELILNTDKVQLSLLKGFASVTPTKAVGKEGAKAIEFKVELPGNDADHYIYESVGFDENNGMIVKFKREVHTLDDTDSMRIRIYKWKEIIDRIVSSTGRYNGYGDAKMSGDEVLNYLKQMSEQMGIFLPANNIDGR